MTKLIKAAENITCGACEVILLAVVLFGLLAHFLVGA
jgi:hypothetical protein